MVESVPVYELKLHDLIEVLYYITVFLSVVFASDDVIFY